MLGSSFFDNDPLFEAHREQMRQMDEMFRDPFGGMMGGGRLALPEQGRRERQRQQQQGQNLAVANRGGFMDPFSHFDSMFSNMRSMMVDMNRAFDQPMASSSDGHMFQQSSVMSYSNTGDGAPRYYQASSSTRQAPGGVKETRQSVRDSATGLEKMAVGHHIKDRSHVIARSRNTKTGEKHENQDLVNLEEDELAAFDRQYQDKWQGRGYTGRRVREDALRGDQLRGVRHTSLDAPRHSHKHASRSKPRAVEFKE